MLTAEEAKALLELHKRKYPLMEMQDAIKLLYQSEFGPGHAINDEAAAGEWLKEELASVVQEDGAELYEPLGGGYSRVFLRAMEAHGMDERTLLSLFIKSARPAGSSLHFSALLRELARIPGLFPLGQKDASEYVESYIALGCPAVHHSKAYNAAYSPAYRVVLAELLGSTRPSK